MELDDLKKFGSVHISHSLWEEFEFVELTINQRQKDDPEYAEMLIRIRHGNPTDSDIEKLKKKVIPNLSRKSINENAADFYMDNYEIYDDNLYAIFPLTDDVDEFNDFISDKLIVNNIIVKAIDTPKSKHLKVGNLQDMNSKISKMKTKDTAGLYTSLKIGVNSRVMLKQNLDVQIGLTNGAIGHIRKIIFNNDYNEVTSVIIKFIGLNDEYEIKKYTHDFEYRKNQYVSRTQFPLTLAWALTNHKIQGLSLDAIMVDIGTNIFENGMAYVALSRAKKFKNVFLINFDETKLCCDELAVKEYNRLNSKNKQGLFRFYIYTNFFYNNYL